MSFDVFDTALYRRVIEPADVFEIVGYRLWSKQLIFVDPATFRAARRDAEARIRSAASANGTLEVTLAEIYEELRSVDVALPIQDCISEELAVERAVLVANADVRRHYHELVAAGKTVVFLSDTYFPEAFIEERLKSLGFDRKHRVFASSVYRTTKASGGLFDIVGNELSCDRSRIAHLGDNFHADAVMGRRHKVNAFWYRPLNTRSPRYRDDDSLVERVTSRLESLATMAPQNDRRLRVIATLGTGMIGPIFLGMTQWLIGELCSDPAELLLFCSRDGYWIAKLAHMLGVPRNFGQARYFEVSRRSLSVPSIADLNDRGLDVLCGNNAALPLRQFFSRIGIDLSKHADTVAECGLRLDQIISSGEDRTKVRALFVRLSNQVVETIGREFPLVLEYCREAGCLAKQDIALIDIGWGATLQTALAVILQRANHTPRIRGFYLSTDYRAGSLPPISGTTRSWFCNAGRPTWMQDVVSQGYWMLEIAFAEPNGSVLGYQMDSGELSVVRQPYDPVDPASRIGVGLQQYAVEFVKQWREIFDGPGPSISAATAFRRFEDAAIHPSKELADLFGDVLHNGGLGNTRESQFIAKPPTLADILLDPSVLRREYFRSHWKKGFLVRVLAHWRLVDAFTVLTQRIRKSRRRLASLHFRDGQANL